MRISRITAGALALALSFGSAGARAETIYMAQKTEMCADIAGGRMVEGTPIQLWPCHGKAPQLFDYDARTKQIVARANRAFCVDDVVRQGLALVRCNATRMKWTIDSSRPAIRSQDGRCWDSLAMKMDPRTRIVLWPCHGKYNQQFSYF